MNEVISGHGGHHLIAAAKAYGVETLFTLSGAHVFPLYDAAIGGVGGYEAAGKDNAQALRSGPLRLVDVRHEATAVFAAEGTAKLTRTPGFAAVTAGPGVTNAISPMASALFNGVPLVVVGGRAPAFRWGTGALQEFDHIPLVEPVTKYAATLSDAEKILDGGMAAFATASEPHRGPAFVDIPMDIFYAPADAEAPASPKAEPANVEGDLDDVSKRLREAKRPLLVVGSDVWMGGAEKAARELAETAGIPVITNGMARGVLPGGHPQLVNRARGQAFGNSDLVVVVGTPLDFRLGYGQFGDPPVPVIQIVDSNSVRSDHAQPTVITGDLRTILEQLRDSWDSKPSQTESDWLSGLTAATKAAVAKDADLLTSDSDPIHPARIYGELQSFLADDTVVIGDGGDFVSFAGRFVEPARPGNWMDPGPFGCLGTGLGYALASGVARPDVKTVLLVGDGSAGFSLMDVDTLVRHKIPTVMIMGNNSSWGLEKHPMRLLHQYDVAADLQPNMRYDEIVKAMGGDGEFVTDPNEIAPAMKRALASDVPYLVNVATDPEASYPRKTTGL